MWIDNFYRVKWFAINLTRFDVQSNHLIRWHFLSAFFHLFKNPGNPAVSRVRQILIKSIVLFFFYIFHIKNVVQYERLMASGNCLRVLRMCSTFSLKSVRAILYFWPKKKNPIKKWVAHQVMLQWFSFAIDFFLNVIHQPSELTPSMTYFNFASLYCTTEQFEADWHTFRIMSPFDEIQQLKKTNEPYSENSLHRLYNTNHFMQVKW